MGTAQKVVIVGSGASGVHFALSVLKKGYEVVMLDVGHPKTGQMNGEETFTSLKSTLSDPVRYFLGENYEGVVYPGSRGEYYGFPPSRMFIFAKPNHLAVDTTGFSPLFSFAQGGLAEAWTGGVYPLGEEDLHEFPFGYSDLEPHYAEVAERIGITGVKDDLARFFPVHASLSQPLALDPHSHGLLSEYERQRDHLNNKLKVYIGHSRVAVLGKDRDTRKGCTYLGRCLWGCPTQALYTPSMSLHECRAHSTFRYIPNMYATHFNYDARGHVSSVVAESLTENAWHEFDADKFVLAAGTLSTSKIFIDSVLRQTGETVKLRGLMDNRQILIPFINMKMIGKTYDPKSYQYHQIALGINSEKPEEYIHGQITTLKAALAHPIIEKIPLDLPTSIFLFRNLRSGLGVINLNLHDTRREENYVSVKVDHKWRHSKLVIKYIPPIDERERIKEAVNRVKKALWRLGCIVPPGMTHVRPMGASVHYAGTIPISTEEISLTCSADCRSHDFENLYIVDGSTFPFLPAKNLTFTLMANAIRVANNAF